MKKILVIFKYKDDPFPYLELHYNGNVETFGNQICKVIDRIDHIYEEMKGNVEKIILEFRPSSVIVNKSQIKGMLFGGKPYFHLIKINK
ncbi:MAG: hypothetical protein IBX72_01915 [Nitrospirae bacterium]|jgi:hypothetical protein|nr:hypothetical protein [Nitrospirota bacterium]